MTKALLGAGLLAIVFAGISLMNSERIAPEGFFPAYQGPAYVAFGWPWGFWRCYESGCILVRQLLLAELVFWILVNWFMVALVFCCRRFLLKK